MLEGRQSLRLIPASDVKYEAQRTDAKDRY
jgi:hypothetical protein